MKVPDTPLNRLRCICGRCPTHNSCMKEKPELLFCSMGKSDCPLVKVSCLCPQCPIEMQYRLSLMYYCDFGAGD